MTDVSLSDLAGKKIRTYSRTQGDFVEGLGASSITLALAEVVPALEKGVADCGVTGTMPADNGQWWLVVTHNVHVRLGFATTFTAINLDTWSGMSAETQALILPEAKPFEDEIWAFEQTLDQAGMDCNAQGPCDRGDPGNMTFFEPNAEDQALLEEDCGRNGRAALGRAVRQRLRAGVERDDRQDHRHHRAHERVLIESRSRRGPAAAHPALGEKEPCLSASNRGWRPRHGARPSSA
ncbi:MAG: hypothetical protein AAGG09_01550 [Pseudomonadota bacterium]